MRSLSASNHDIDQAYPCICFYFSVCFILELLFHFLVGWAQLPNTFFNLQNPLGFARSTKFSHLFRHSYLPKLRINAQEQRTTPTLCEEYKRLLSLWKHYILRDVLVFRHQVGNLIGVPHGDGAIRGRKPRLTKSLHRYQRVCYTGSFKGYGTNRIQSIKLYFLLCVISDDLARFKIYIYPSIPLPN